MKLLQFALYNSPHRVAPCAGAWIETKPSAGASSVVSVAPCAGAWIETRETKYKLFHVEVAPCAGAWIETRRPRLTKLA